MRNQQKAQAICAFLASSISSVDFLFSLKLFRESEFDFSPLDSLCQLHQLIVLDHSEDRFDTVLERYENVLIPTFQHWKRSVCTQSSDKPEDLANKLQQILYDQDIESLINYLEDQHRSSDQKHLIQRYNSSSYVHSGKFLQAIPALPPLELSDTAFRLALKQRCFIPHFDHQPTVHCDCSRNLAIDDYGDHLLTCPKNTEFMMRRHDAIVNCLAQLATEARISKAVEPRRSFHETTEKRPDIILYNSHLHGGATIAIDVSITHPVSPH